MDRPRSIFRTPTFVALAVTFLLFLLYAYLQDHQGNAVHIFRSDRHIYVSMEDFGAMLKYEVFTKDFASLPDAFELEYDEKWHIFTLKDKKVPPKTLGFSKKKELSFPGSVVSTELYSNTLYVVDELTGIYLIHAVDLKVPDKPTIPFFGAQDILVANDAAYIAGGEAGVFVYAIGIPTATLALKTSLDTEGSAEALAVYTRMGKETAESEDQETGESKKIEKEVLISSTLYVADGANGVVILDAKQPVSPTRTVTISRQGFVNNVLYHDDHLYISQGEQGWSIVNVRNPKQYRDVLLRDTKGDVQDIAVNERFIAVADGKNGLLVYHNAEDLTKISANPAAVIRTTGFVSDVELVKNYAILADGVEGVKVVDLANLEHPVMRTSAATPGEYSFRQVWANRLQPQDSSEREKFERSLDDLRNEAMMLAAGMVILLFFVAMATLPARSLRYWLQRERAQPVTVDGGQIVSTRQTRHANRMRAIHVDTASAAAVVSLQGTRWLGPGLGFMQRRERLGRTLDLRPALVISGPFFREDPFTLDIEEEGGTQRAERQLRREETSAKTKDAVEIVPNFLMDVRVDGTPGEGGSGYGYNETNAQLALLPDLETYEQTLPYMSPAAGWYELVTGLARQLWLEYLVRYTLDELFIPLPDVQNTFPGTARTGLQRVAWLMQCHLTQAQVPRLDENAQPTGEMMQSAQYEALRLRGLRLSRLQVINLRLTPEARQRYEEAWLATWPARALLERGQVDAQQAQRAERAKKDARRRFRQIVSQPEQSVQAQPGRQAAPLTEREILISRVQGTLNLPELSPGMRQRYNDLLASLQGWI